MHNICDPLWEKVHFHAKTKIELLASKESAKLVLSNDAIVTLVAASVFAPYMDIWSIRGAYYFEIECHEYFIRLA